jgi:hypothetical protein
MYQLQNRNMPGMQGKRRHMCLQKQRMAGKAVSEPFNAACCPE